MLIQNFELKFENVIFFYFMMNIMKTKIKMILINSEEST